MKKVTLVTWMVVYLLAVTIVFTIVSLLCNASIVEIRPSQKGEVDLTQLDLEKFVALVPTDAAYIYDCAFYMPEDFAAGTVTDVPVQLHGTKPRLGDFGTVRFVLRLPAGQVYAISSKSTAYAQRLFINGEEYAPVGVTGDRTGTVVPKVTPYTEAFLPKSDTTEIILHYSNFVHPDVGSLYALRVGTVNNISRTDQLRTFQVVLAIAALVTAALVFFGLYLFSPNNRSLFWFALICACIALRGLLTGDKLLMLLTPDLNWSLALRLEYLATVGLIAFSALYLNALFTDTLHTCVIRGFIIFCMANILVYVLTPVMFFTHIVWYSLGVTVLFFLYALIWILQCVLHKRVVCSFSFMEQVLLLVGSFVYLLFSGLEIYAHENARFLWGLDYAQVGIIIFLFVNLLTLAQDFSRTRKELDKARRSEQEMEETNRMLERLDKLKTDFLSNVSHEMRTPLMVMSGYAQLTFWQMDAGTVNEETKENLQVISQEAQRLAELASGLLRVSAEVVWERETVAPEKLLERAETAGRSILMKNRNRLEMKPEKNLPTVQANENMLVQVLLNLIINANRHTKNGIIRICVFKQEENQIAFTVEDNGDGIPPGLLPHIFERHVSGDGGSGLGLAICRDTIEAHGGYIYAETPTGGGVRITFTLPYQTAKEDKNLDSHNSAN